MITMCYNIKLCLMLGSVYIALEFGFQRYNFLSWANILGNVLPRY
jgi:hypothetical protein